MTMNNRNSNRNRNRNRLFHWSQSFNLDPRDPDQNFNISPSNVKNEAVCGNENLSSDNYFDKNKHNKLKPLNNWTKLVSIYN